MSQTTVDFDSVSQDKLPDWRFRQASRAAAQGRLLIPVTADRVTRQLSLLLARQKSCRSSADRHRLQQSKLAQTYAELLRLAHDATRESVCTVEALILAEVSTAKIAERTGITGAAAELYEHIFCDVRNRLRDQTYIYAHVLRPELQRGAPETARRRFVMKFLGYHCGAQTLDALYPRWVQRANFWEHPTELVERLLAERELDALVELVSSEDGIQKLSPHRLQKLAGSLRECLTDRGPKKPFDKVRSSATPDEMLAYWKRSSQS